MWHASAAGFEFLYLPLGEQRGNLSAGAGRSRHVWQPGGDEFRRADYFMFTCGDAFVEEGQRCYEPV